jgi:hypothetical protein
MITQMLPGLYSMYQQGMAYTMEKSFSVISPNHYHFYKGGNTISVPAETTGNDVFTPMRQSRPNTPRG